MAVSLRLMPVEEDPPGAVTGYLLSLQLMSPRTYARADQYYIVITTLGFLSKYAYYSMGTRTRPFVGLSLTRLRHCAYRTAERSHKFKISRAWVHVFASTARVLL